MIEQQEIWKNVEGFEGIYQISSLGRIRNAKGFFMTPIKTDDGYYRVHLRKTGISKNCRLHRLVAAAFIQNPENKPEVNHKNGIKTDNRVENLEWTTKSENALHAYKNGLQSTIYKFRIKEIDFNQCRKINYLYKNLGYSIRKLSQEFGYPRKTINSIINAGVV